MGTDKRRKKNDKRKEELSFTRDKTLQIKGSK
jgi:hypothetical protein